MSITGSAKLVGPAVVNRTHELFALVTWYLNMRTLCTACPPLGCVSVVAEISCSGIWLRKAVVVVDALGVPNKIDPLPVSLWNASKSVISLAMSGAVAVLVKVTSVPGVTALFWIAAKVGATLFGVVALA